jgi:hypothetical protein
MSRTSVFAVTLAVTVLLLAGLPLDAQTDWPVPHRAYVDYDPSIPTPAAVLGHHPAESITAPDGFVRYLTALAEAAPERTRLVEYAHSWEGRPLVLLAIGSAARMSRIEEVKAGLARLADPRGLSRGEEDRLVAELPVVTALMHSVHGNEISPAGSSLVTAYHLLAARGDAEVDRILAESIVLIDPLQNPDGRARGGGAKQTGVGALLNP